MSKPKLGDVAARAGVSPTTVSRVLNNRGYLSQRTREKVYDAMRELGYRPNAIARSLKGQRSRIVGLVFPTVANPFYAEMVYRIESFLADAGYRVILCNSDDHPDLEEQYFEMLLSNQVDGIITGAHSQVVANLPHVQAPLVTVDRPGTQKYPNIRADNYAGARMAVEHLVATGAGNILHITSTVSEQNLRLAGYRDAVTAAGMTPQVLELGFRTPLPRKRELIERYLKESTTGERVDAVFASNDTYAAMTLNWARTRNLCVPQDFQVGGLTAPRQYAHLSRILQLWCSRLSRSPRVQCSGCFRRSNRADRATPTIHHRLIKAIRSNRVPRLMFSQCTCTKAVPSGPLPPPLSGTPDLATSSLCRR